MDIRDFDNIEIFKNAPVYAFMQQKCFGCLPSLNKTVKVHGRSFNLSDYILNGNPDKIAFPIFKMHLADHFNVDKKTLCKWVKCFMPPSYYKKWLTKKKINEQDFELLDKHLGINIFLSHLPKDKLANLAKTKKEAILTLLEDPEIEVFDIEVYKSMNKFPTKVADKLFKLINSELSD